MAEGTAGREVALEQMQNTVPGLPPEKYAAELDGALVRIEGHRMDVRRRRAELVTHARSLDALNAVFTVHYYNRRYSRHIGQYGLGPLDLTRVLDGAVQPQRIDEEIRRSDALIEDALRMRGGTRDREINLASLRDGHPGFDDRALADALAWGGVINR